MRAHLPSIPSKSPPQRQGSKAEFSVGNRKCMQCSRGSGETGSVLKAEVLGRRHSKIKATDYKQCSHDCVRV